MHVQFNGLYEAAIDGAERAALPAKRIAAIIDHMTFEIYKYIQRGLFERHKLIFAWMLTASILVSAGKARPHAHHTRECRQQLLAMAPHSVCLLARLSMRVYRVTPHVCNGSPRLHIMQIKADDVNVFLRGGGALDINSVRKKPKVQSSNVFMQNASCNSKIRWLRRTGKTGATLSCC